MSTELQSESTTPEPDNTATPEPDNTATPEPDSTTTPSPSSDSTPFSGTSEIPQQLQQIWDKVSGWLGNLPDYVTDFFQEYRRPIITIALLVAAVVSVKVVLAILGAVSEIPLLSPTFELIGLGYSGWFIYRYLLRASNRRELMEDINSLRDQVMGKHS
ncbi:Glutamate--tRNA ligase [Halomicronema hongdechloris C2206]|uniref:Glutamate--tRNA ligase n=1 Tax=Halomicronema hongdechloris C2206 TaxID=1641165 RepID=A0A1Z3HL95_9CYAN|nr:CAAD domain-containing protein [Halomicronema hongdechloris]ASC71081.1 Glutamate--tRNA ligase [Halomicronema hongdechloris C2206]